MVKNNKQVAGYISGYISFEVALPSLTDSNRVVESQSKATLLIYIEIKEMSLSFHYANTLF